MTEAEQADFGVWLYTFFRDANYPGPRKAARAIMKELTKRTASDPSHLDPRKPEGHSDILCFLWDRWISDSYSDTSIGGPLLGIFFFVLETWGGYEFEALPNRMLGKKIPGEEPF